MQERTVVRNGLEVTVRVHDDDVEAFDEAEKASSDAAATKQKSSVATKARKSIDNKSTS